MPNLMDFWPSLLFIAALLLLPLLAQLAKKKGWYKRGQADNSIKTVNTIRITPQQHITVIEWQTETHRRQFLLGISHQSITLLDSVELPSRINSDTSTTEPSTSEIPHHAN